MPMIDTQFGPIFYRERGGGVPLLAVHGAGGTHRHWGYQLAGLHDVARVIAFDLPGHGRSSGPPHTTIAEGVGRMLALMDALGVEQAVVMGHSMGGGIAQWLAINAPERVRGLVLVGTGARLRVVSQILEGIERNFAATTELITHWAYRPDAPPAVLEPALAELRATVPGVLHSDYAACNVFDVMHDLGHIAVPTLIVVGEEDQLTPLKYSQWLHAALPRSELAVIPAAGHMVMVEQYAAVNHAVRAWLVDHLVH